MGNAIIDSGAFAHVVSDLKCSKNIVRFPVVKVVLANGPALSHAHRTSVSRLRLGEDFGYKGVMHPHFEREPDLLFKLL